MIQTIMGRFRAVPWHVAALLVALSVATLVLDVREVRADHGSVWTYVSISTAILWISVVALAWLPGRGKPGRLVERDARK